MSAVKRVARPPAHKQKSLLVPLSCPDCAGILSRQVEGPRRYPVYHCQIDHRYSLRSLLQAKEKQLENSLWSVVVLMKHVESVYEQLKLDAGQARSGDHKRVQQRLAEVDRHRAAILAMIEAAHVLE
jgi:hypothetical protein